MCIMANMVENVDSKIIWKIVYVNPQTSKYEPIFWFPRHLQYTIENPKEIKKSYRRKLGVEFKGGISGFETRQQARNFMKELKSQSKWRVRVIPRHLRITKLEVSGDIYYGVNKDDKSTKMLIAQYFVKWIPER